LIFDQRTYSPAEEMELERRYVVGSCCAEKAGWRLGFLTGFVLSAAVLLQPPIAAAADAKGGNDNNVAAAASVSVVLRGTRPVSATPAQSPRLARERNRAPSPYMGFQPAPLSGSGWDTGYSTDGLSYTSGAASQ
jgi:hypothetical protein